MILTEDLKLRFKKLFHEQKFYELISLIEKTIEPKDRPAGLWNLLGVARLSEKKPTKEILIAAVNDFKEGYFKDNNSQNAIEALGNLINTSVELFDLDNSLVNFQELIGFYNNSKIYCLNNYSINYAMHRIYKRLNDVEEIIFHLKKIIENKKYTSNDLVSYIYHRSFNKLWTQKDFLDYGNLLDNNLKEYSSSKLINFPNIKNDKIKIGFLSGDIRSSHSVTYFLKTVLDHYDKNKYEIILILNQNVNDQTTDYFKNIFDKTINIVDYDDIKAINEIRSLSLDFIYDLMGLTSTNRINLFKNRIAKKQIIWLGYCNTSGVKNMDYILADANLIYPEEEHFYSEKIIYLPEIWNCHSGIFYERKKNILPITNKGFITFGSFNNFNKINDEVVETWSNILKNVKNSRLFLKNSIIKQSNARLKDKFKDKNVLESVFFLERERNFEDHLKIYENIDIALDTFPYNGVTTSFEATWMGVPVLTMKGYNFNSRCGESINKNLDLEYLIANDKNDYISKAISLSNDITKLSNFREKIFNNCMKTSLFDTKKFSNDFFSIVENLNTK